MAQRSPDLKKVVERIRQRIRNQWETDADFHRQARPHVAYYSVRRMFDQNGPAPSVDTLVDIALAAGFRPSEVREMLVKIGDRTIHRLIPAESTELSDRERALVDAVRQLQAKNGKIWARVADHLSLLAQAAGVDISEQVQRMGR